MSDKKESREQEQKLKSTLRFALDEDAYERLMNVSIANKEMYLIAAKNLLMLYKRMGRKITESELLSLLRAIKAQRENETKITFQKK